MIRSFSGAAAIAAGLLIVAVSGAQKPLELTVDTIMRGPQLAGYEPSDVRWSGDSRRVYFHWKRYTDAVTAPMDTYVANSDATGLRKLSEQEERSAPPVQASLDRERTRGVYTRDGDVWLYDYTSDRARRLTQTTDAETGPRFTHDGRRVAFTRANNLYVISLEDGSEVELTDIRPAGSPLPDPKKGTDSQEWIKKEERDLLESVRDRAERREQEEARRKRENPRKPLILAARQRVAWMQLTPDEKFVLAGFTTAPEDAKQTIIPKFVTESAYTEDISGRTNVGDARDALRVAILDAATGDVRWIDKRTEAPVWSEDGTRAVISVRSDDNKDRWLYLLDPALGSLSEIAHDHDNAWVDGPAWRSFGFLKNGDVWFTSERSGFSHLYSVNSSNGEARALTSGKWEVQGVRLSEDRSNFYLTTNEGGPEQVHLWSMPVEGGARTRITGLPGDHITVVSRDNRLVADVHSYTNQPYELYIMENRAGANELRATTSPAPEFSTYPWLDAPVTHFRARDGVDVPVRVYKPAALSKGAPAVIFVHGAGYLQNVHRWWSYYYREYMFHNLLRDRGYAVIDIDYRGSAGYGRDWRTAIYDHMGGKDLDDHVDAALWLVNEFGVDAKRIGIYGGSYGGFITLMAMFKEPGVFAAGAALRPVTDWAHYNGGYTSNILNNPQTDPEAYRRSSPIYFASGLKGALLICHGMVDVNVHFQDSVRLAQRLIELRKENWELAPYPVEDHAFVLPSSWADEYKRILKLFETNLRR